MRQANQNGKLRREKETKTILVEYTVCAEIDECLDAEVGGYDLCVTLGCPMDPRRAEDDSAPHRPMAGSLIVLNLDWPSANVPEIRQLDTV